SGPARPILPVILCGGAGTRLWPVSTEAAPNPFHALLSDKSLFQMTVARIAGHGEDGFLAPMIVCGRTHRALVEAQLEAIGVEAALLVLEPRGRGASALSRSSDHGRGGVSPYDQGRRGHRRRLDRHPWRRADTAGDRLR